MTRHTTQFDALADTYAVDEFPIKTWVEAPSFYRVLGSVVGHDVLDLGCGNGLYTRSLKQHGARRVLGVDIASKMIDVANAIERERPVGVEYAVHDAAQLPVLGIFDEVVAIHLLHYAEDVMTMAEMINCAGRQLRPGGRLIALVHNPDCVDLPPGRTEKYGYVVHMPVDRVDSAPITMNILAGPELPTRGDAFTIRFQYYRRSVYETLLRDAGFRDISWHRFDTSSQLHDDRQESFWRTVLENPYSDVLSCHLP